MVVGDIPGDENVRIAFEIDEGNLEDLPPRYQEVSCDIIFDVNMGENFHRKSQMVAGGNNTTAPSSLTYLSMLSRYSVRIALTITVLNHLNFLVCNIQNSYLTAKFRKKMWTVERT